MQLNTDTSPSVSPDFIWLREWRADYKALSHQIRVQKIEVKDAHRSGALSEASVRQMRLAALRRRAGQMMIDRTEFDRARREGTVEAESHADIFSQAA